MSLTLEQKFKQADENENYALKDFNKLRQTYPDTYIGILKGTVKYHDKNLDNLLATIRADRGGSVEGVFVLFLPDKRATIIV